MCDIANNGSLHLDRLAYDSQHDMGREMTEIYLFGIVDGHVAPFRTGPHKSTVSECACVVKRIRRMHDIFCKEFFNTRKVALRPQFECHITDIHKRQLGHCKGNEKVRTSEQLIFEHTHDAMRERE